MPGDGTCPKLLELLPVLEPHATAMDRESRQEKKPQLQAQLKLPNSSSSSESRVGSGLAWILRNSKPTCKLPHLAYPSLAAQRPTHVTSAHLTTAAGHVVPALLIPPAQVLC